MYPRIFEKCWNWGNVVQNTAPFQVRWNNFLQVGGKQELFDFGDTSSTDKNNGAVESYPSRLAWSLVLSNYYSETLTLQLVFCCYILLEEALNPALGVLCVSQPPAGRCWEMRTGTRCQQDLGCTVGNLNNEHCAGTERQGTSESAVYRHKVDGPLTVR